MKLCLLCGAEAADSVETCPNDGEASWSTSESTSESADTESDATKTRKSKR